MNSGDKFQFSWPVLGNQSVVDFLQKSINNNRLAHFYIMAGAKDLGKSTLANYFTSSLLCNNLVKGQGGLPCDQCSHCQQFKAGNHSDVIIIARQKDKKNISINQIREFINRLSLGSFGSFYKIGIIKEAEYLSIEAANALLKILEEPKKGVVIILLTSQLDVLPATIVSRGQTLYFRPVAVDVIYDYLLSEHGASRDAAKNLSRLSAGRPALAVKFIEDKEFFKDYQRIAATVLQIISGDINEKINLISELLSFAKGREAVDKANQVLEIWQIVLRDLLLLNFHLEEKLINETIVGQLKEVNLSMDGFIKINEKIKESKKYLAANVNPQLVLEELSLNM